MGNFSNQRVFLGSDGQNGFWTNKYGKNSVADLNSKIYDYIGTVYGPFGFSYPSDSDKNYDIKVDGEIISSEYISKMVNNYTIFKAFIRENSIQNETDFYTLIESKFDDVYHYRGDFFKRHSLPILINTTRKGNINEIRCKEKFKEFAESKKINVIIENPSIKEDIEGIDAKFKHGDRYFTIQIKPFSKYTYKDDSYYFRSPGSLSIGSVSYLILYSDDKIVIIKNSKNDPIRIYGNFYITSKSNILLI